MMESAGTAEKSVQIHMGLYTSIIFVCIISLELGPRENQGFYLGLALGAHPKLFQKCWDEKQNKN
ncbi:MAG: hypothetical protein MJE68_08240 [Proteobacteria bacterium]|nr:hypothetical protein [Pseudomonadota bacterium]